MVFWKAKILTSFLNQNFLMSIISLKKYINAKKCQKDTKVLKSATNAKGAFLP